MSKACTPQLESSPHALQLEKSPCRNRDPAQPKIIKRKGRDRQGQGGRKEQPGVPWSRLVVARCGALAGLQRHQRAQSWVAPVLVSRQGCCWSSSLGTWCDGCVFSKAPLQSWGTLAQQWCWAAPRQKSLRAETGRGWRELGTGWESMSKDIEVFRRAYNCGSLRMQMKEFLLLLNPDPKSLEGLFVCQHLWRAVV